MEEMNANAPQKLNALTEIFHKISKYLVKHNEKFYSKRFESLALRSAEPFEDEKQARNRLQKIRSTYLTMTSGPGTFSDFFIWHEDINERRKLNAPLSRLIDEVRKNLF